MGGAAGPDLAAEVSRAGGLGIIAGNLQPADKLREAIRKVRQHTDRPFGVNVLLPPEFRAPLTADAKTLEAVHNALNPMRETLGLPKGTISPSVPQNPNTEAIEVILEERVPVFSVGLGDPGPELIAECHRRHIKVIAMVTTVHDALAVEAAGLDAVIAQGTEAGGHRSHFVKPMTSEQLDVGTVALVPEVADAVRIPVIAAGGLVDGRGLVAALALGASGVLMGTRFVATRESMVTEVYKKALLERSGDTTALSDVLSGRFARALRNAFIERYKGSGAPVLSFPLHYIAVSDIRQEAEKQSNEDYQAMWSGQGVGLIRDLPSASDVVETIIQEARQIMMKTLPQRVQLET